MNRRGILAALALLAIVAAGCAGTTHAGLLQDGPTLRPVAADGTMVVEGRAFNLSARPLDGAQGLITIRRDAEQPLVVMAPLGDGGHVGAFETVTFRIETGIRVLASAQTSIAFSALDAP